MPIVPPKMRRKWAKIRKNSKFLVLAWKKEKKRQLLLYLVTLGLPIFAFARKGEVYSMGKMQWGAPWGSPSRAKMANMGKLGIMGKNCILLVSS